jgi:hypothetical protein
LGELFIYKYYWRKKHMPRNPLPPPPKNRGKNAVRPPDDNNNPEYWYDWINRPTDDFTLWQRAFPDVGMTAYDNPPREHYTFGRPKFVKPTRGAGARKRLYKADEKDDSQINPSWPAKLSEAAVDYVLRNKSLIEDKAKKWSDKGFNYINQNKANIGRGAKNLTERAIDTTLANKKNIERGVKFVSDKAFDYVRRNKPDIEGVDYVLNNKSNIEREGKRLSDEGFDYLRRNKSGIGRSVENATNQAIDYVSRNKKNIEREAQNYANQAFDYLRNNKKRIGREAQNAINRVTGKTTKRATSMYTKSVSNSRQGGFVNGKPVSIKKMASKNKYF